MNKEPNISLYITALVIAYFGAGIAYYTFQYLCNNNETSGMLSIIVMVAVFCKVVSSQNGSAIDVTHPSAMLVSAPPVRVLGELKEALASKHFGDKRWSMDFLNEQKGTASFSCIVKRQTEKEQKQHTVVLLAQTGRLSNASSLVLQYEVIGETLHRKPALDLCTETTALIEQQMQALRATATAA